MKAYKAILKTTVILAIILLVLISFIGIYQIKGYDLSNIIKDYSLGMEFKGSKEISLEVDTSAETKIYDSEGKLVEEQEEGIDYTEDNGYKTVEEKANNEDILTKSNFNRVKSILAKRLDKLKAQQYIIRQDETNGNIVVQIPNDDNSEVISGVLASEGNFTITDSETEDVLMDKSSISNVGIQYYPQQDENILVVLLISLNKEGKETFKELSDVYVSSLQDVTNEETGETTQETVEKNVKVNIDDEPYLEMYFQKDMGEGVVVWLDAQNGIITIPVGRSANTEETKTNLKKASGLKAILDEEIIPIKYNATTKIISGSYENVNLKLAIYIISFIFAIALIITIFKFKLRGFYTLVLEVGYIATLLLLIRITNVTITISGIVGITISSILNMIFLLNVVKNTDKSNWEIVKSVIIKFTLSIIPLIIISVIFTFSSILGMSSLGMTLFWGIILIYIYNLIFTNILL